MNRTLLITFIVLPLAALPMWPDSTGWGIIRARIRTPADGCSCSRVDRQGLKPCPLRRGND